MAKDRNYITLKVKVMHIYIVNVLQTVTNMENITTAINWQVSIDFRLACLQLTLSNFNDQGHALRI